MHISKIFQKFSYEWIQDEDGKVISFVACIRPAKIKLSKILLKQEWRMNGKIIEHYFTCFYLLKRVDDLIFSRLEIASFYLLF